GRGRCGQCGLVRGFVRSGYELLEWHGRCGYEAGEADSGRQLVQGAARRVVVVEVLLQAGDHRLDAVIGRLDGQHAELVATEARDDVRIAEGLLENFRGRDDGPIAFVMAEG